MATFTDSRELADFLLQNAAQCLADSAPRANHHSLRSVGGASALLGFGSYAETCATVLNSLPDENFTAGIISNSPHTQEALTCDSPDRSIGTIGLGSPTVD